MQLSFFWLEVVQVKHVYYPEVEGLLKRMTGASRIHVMMHGLRRGKIGGGYEPKPTSCGGGMRYRKSSSFSDRLTYRTLLGVTAAADVVIDTWRK